MTTQPAESIRHVYHLSPVRLAIFPALWILGAALCGLIWFSSPDRFTPAAVRMLFILIGIVTLFVAPFFALMWQSRLVLTPEGIAHHQFGYTVRSTWENLVALDLSPRVQSLILARPGTRARLLSASVGVLDVAAPGLAAGLVGDSRAYAEGRLIGLAPYMAHWKHGGLRDDLLRWAPQLFN